MLRRQTCSLMLDHIAGKDRILRDEGLECLRYIIITKRESIISSDIGTLDITVYSIALNYPFPYVLSLDSVVICLSNLNSEAYEFEIAFRQTGHGYRTPHYSNALAILIRLLRYATNDGGVLPWLESYPFGGHSTVEDKRKSIQQLLSEKYSHEPMYTVMLYAFRIPVLQNGLVGCNLVDKEMVDQGRKTLWIRMEDLGITSNDAEFYRHVRGNITGFEADLARLRARARGGSFEAALEEQYLRRRRREAVVVGEVGRPFEAEDIFVPIHHDTEIVPPNFNLDPDQSQTLETENQITAAEQETISRPSTPELESEESMSE